LKSRRVWRIKVGRGVKSGRGKVFGHHLIRGGNISIKEVVPTKGRNFLVRKLALQKNKQEEKFWMEADKREKERNFL